MSRNVTVSRLAPNQAIVTKYFGPRTKPNGDIRGDRIKATAFSGSKYRDYCVLQCVHLNHELAAVALIRHLGWDKHKPPGKWAHGILPNGDHVFTWIEDAPEDTFTWTKE